MFAKTFFQALLFLSLLPVLLFPNSPTPSPSPATKKPSLLQLLKPILPETARDRKERHYLFLKHVSHSLKRPEIWNDLQNLLLILMQFEQFANQDVGSRCYEAFLAQVIAERIHFLLSKQQVSERTDIRSPKIGDS